MRYGSLFAGIGGIDLGLDRAGMECVWQVEIDPYCQKVLEKHWPNARRFKDVKECGKENLEPVDLICGGFPCQDLSVAGKRSGLAGERSGLFFEFMRIVAELSPRWILIENVPGLLSSNGGRDMGTVLGEVGKLGYGWAYRVLDAQYFGLAQRRRRVFIVGCLGDRQSAAEVLFEPESVCRDSPPSRETRARVAATVTPGIDTNRNGWAPMNEADNLVAHALTSCKTATGRLDPTEQELIVAKPLRSQAQASHREDSETYIPMVIRDERGRCNDGRISDKAFPLHAAKGQSKQQIVIGPLCANAATKYKHGDGGITSIQQYLSGHIQPDRSGMAVRRLTPTECERLQGFPDGWTEGVSDSVRYRMLGNAVAVPVAEWIGKKIKQSDLTTQRNVCYVTKAPLSKERFGGLASIRGRVCIGSDSR